MVYKKLRIQISKFEALVSLTFIVAVLLGINTSSLGIESIRESSAQSREDIIFGSPQPIRSDEYFRWSPWRIGVLKSNDADFSSPLSVEQNSLVWPDGDSYIDRLTAFEVFIPAMSPLGSLEQKFAFIWFLPIFLVAIFLPRYLHTIGIDTKVSRWTTLIVIFSPAVAWWSYLPLNSIVWPILAVLAFDKLLHAVSLQKKVFFGAVTSVMLLKLAFGYLPWNIVLAPPIIFAYLVMQKRSRREVTIKSIFIAATSLLLVAIFLSRNLLQLETFQNTVYPGQRRALGERQPLPKIFSAFFSSGMNRVGSSAPTGTNQSEFSTFPTYLALVALALASVKTYVNHLRLSARSILLLAFFLVWCLWILVDWPSWSTHLIPLSLVTPKRAVQAIGLIGILLLASVIEDFKDSKPQRAHLRLTVPIVILSAVFNYVLSNKIVEVYLPATQTWVVWATIASLTVSTFILIQTKFFVHGLSIIAFTLAILTFSINPVQMGIGDLANSTASKTINELASSNTSAIWMSDDIRLDAIFMSNAIKSLSGQQIVGPSEYWEELDPLEMQTSSWNRGASFIVFTFTNSNTSPIITANVPDVVSVSVNPCWLVENSIHTSIYFITASEDFYECAKKVDQITWSGIPRYIYSVN